MNREIKFRGYSESKWIYGWLVKNQAGHYYIRSRHDFHTYGVKPETIGQYIGLKDKDGKEIYEGDVMGWKHLEGTKNQIRWVVEFNPLIGYKTWSSSKNDEIILGNIHDNPELL